MRRLFLLLSCAAVPLAAQSSVREGATVRVAVEGTRLQGRVVRVQPPGLVLRLADGSERTIDRPDTLWTRGSKAKGGALIGGAAGFAIGAGLGAVVCDAVAEGAGCDAWGAVLLAGAAVGVGGGLVGLGIGSAIPSWRRQPVALHAGRGLTGRLQLGLAFTH